jgi:hypothetical protein
VVLFSHHPLETLVNGTRPPGADRRILADELRDVLLGHPCVIAWVNGHTHTHTITAIRADGAPGGFWQITTASHIDWPQQSRVIELLATDGGLAICCTVLDTAAPAAYAHGELRLALAARRGNSPRRLAIRIEITDRGGAGGTADRSAVLLVEWRGRAPAN